MTETPQQAAREAIKWHKQQEARGEVQRSCYMYDGKDNGPPERRCWLQPGHQCDCMTEMEARIAGGQVRWSREDMQDWADWARDDEDPPFDAQGWESRGVVVIPPTPENDRFLLALERLGGARNVVETLAIGADHAAKPPAMTCYIVDAGDVYHILPESEAREWEAEGHTIRKLPPKKPGEFAPDHVYNLPKLTEQQLRAFGADGWDVAPPTWHVPDDGPNAGKQAPPPRREWWAEQCKGKGTPGLGCQKQGKRARKAQKLARKANRSK